MKSKNKERYRGDGAPPNGDETKRFPYLADQDLVKAVNIAITLERPLLVKGPPGTGKTKLAYSIAHELGLEAIPWPIKSTERAKDGLYTIDMVRRLQDAQLQLKDETTQSLRAQMLTPYISFGPLGKAFSSDKQSVLLIDEVDKADIDFPNDLLHELEEKRFTIVEIDQLTKQEEKAGWQKTYQAKHYPIIVITSNDEKELSDAFLRRCIFHYIEFPAKDQLIEIVRANTTHLKIRDEKLKSSLIERAVSQLDKFRKIEDLRKMPATSELIDWVRVLIQWGVKPEELVENKPLSALPHWQVLFKHQPDVLRVKRTDLGENPL